MEPSRNAYVDVRRVLPRLLPGLGYRYLFDRSSFYQDPERYREPPAACRRDHSVPLADIRFPLERANGVHTMETCVGTGRAEATACTCWSGPTRRSPARDPFPVLRRPGDAATCAFECVPVCGPPPGSAGPAYLALDDVERLLDRRPLETRSTPPNLSPRQRRALRVPRRAAPAGRLRVAQLSARPSQRAMPP